MSRSLLETVSLEELKSMYDSGMTYRDISEAVGASYTTIASHLRGYGRRGGSRIASSMPRKEAAPAPSEEVSPRLVVQNKSIELHGRFGTYIVDSKKKNVTVALPKNAEEETLFEINFEHLEDVVGELQAIQRKIDSLNMTNEMW